MRGTESMREMVGVRQSPNMNPASDRTVRSDSLEDGQAPRVSPDSSTALALQDALPTLPTPTQDLPSQPEPLVLTCPKYGAISPRRFLEPGAPQVHRDVLASPTSDGSSRPRTGAWSTVASQAQALAPKSKDAYSSQHGSHSFDPLSCTELAS